MRTATGESRYSGNLKICTRAGVAQARMRVKCSCDAKPCHRLTHAQHAQHADTMSLQCLDADSLRVILRELTRRVVNARHDKYLLVKEYRYILYLSAACKAFRDALYDADESSAIEACGRATLLDLRVADGRPGLQAIQRRCNDRQLAVACRCFLSSSGLGLCPERCCLNRRAAEVHACREFYSVNLCLRPLSSAAVASSQVPGTSGMVFLLVPVEATTEHEIRAARGEGADTASSLLSCVLFKDGARVATSSALLGRPLNASWIGRIDRVPMETEREQGELAEVKKDMVTRMEAVSESICVLEVTGHGVLVARVNLQSCEVCWEVFYTVIRPFNTSISCVFWKNAQPFLAFLSSCGPVGSRHDVVVIQTLAGDPWGYTKLLCQDSEFPLCIVRGSEAGTAVVALCRSRQNSYGRIGEIVHSMAVRVNAHRYVHVEPPPSSARGGVANDFHTAYYPVHGKGVVVINESGVSLLHEYGQTKLLAANMGDVNCLSLKALNVGNCVTDPIWATVTPSLTDLLLTQNSGAVWRVDLSERVRSKIVMTASVLAAEGARVAFWENNVVAVQLTRGVLVLSSDSSATNYRACDAGHVTPCRLAIVGA